MASATSAVALLLLQALVYRISDDGGMELQQAYEERRVGDCRGA